MTLDVSNETADRVSAAVASGHAVSADALVSQALDALERLRQESEEKEGLRAFLQSRADAALSGGWDDVTIDDIKRQARADFESRSA